MTETTKKEGRKDTDRDCHGLGLTVAHRLCSDDAIGVFIPNPSPSPSRGAKLSPCLFCSSFLLAFLWAPAFRQDKDMLSLGVWVDRQ